MRFKKLFHSYGFVRTTSVRSASGYCGELQKLQRIKSFTSHIRSNKKQAEMKRSFKIGYALRYPALSAYKGCESRSTTQTFLMFNTRTSEAIDFGRFTTGNRQKAPWLQPQTRRCQTESEIGTSTPYLLTHESQIHEIKNP
jgi:hypothetical protein